MLSKIKGGLEVAQLVSWLFSLAFVQTALIPFGAAALAIISGWLNEVPWILTLILATATFAFVVWGILGLVLLRALLSVDDKLSVDGHSFFQDVTPENNALKLDVVQFALNLRNRAPFSVSYEVTKITSNFDGRIATSSVFDNKGGTIPPEAQWFFRDTPIQLTPPLSFPVSGGLQRKTGTLEYELKYGRGKKRNKTLKGKINISAAIDPSARTLGWSWTTAPTP